MPPAPRLDADADAHVDRHLVAGFVALFSFAAGGLGLEVLHAFKVPLLVDAGAETTRLLLRLAHAHGALLGLVQVAWAAALGLRPRAARGDVSAALLGALVLLPAGFALGALPQLGARAGDPGPLVALAPVGAASLLYGLGRAVGALRRSRSAPRT